MAGAEILVGHRSCARNPSPEHLHHNMSITVRLGNRSSEVDMCDLCGQWVVCTHQCAYSLRMHHLVRKARVRDSVAKQAELAKQRGRDRRFARYAAVYFTALLIFAVALYIHSRHTGTR
jgi:hypothetical protein